MALQFLCFDYFLICTKSGLWIESLKINSSHYTVHNDRQAAPVDVHLPSTLHYPFIWGYSLQKGKLKQYSNCCIWLYSSCICESMHDIYIYILQWFLSTRYFNFPYPITLTMIHMGFSGVVAFFLICVVKVLWPHTSFASLYFILVSTVFGHHLLL